MTTPLHDLLADDHLFVDGIEPVILQYQPPPDPATRRLPGIQFHFVPHALRRERELVRDLAAPADAIVWHLWENGLNGIVPTGGSTIIDRQGEVFYVLAAKLQTLQSRYRCVCRKPDAGTTRHQPWSTFEEFLARKNAPTEQLRGWQSQ